MIVEEGGRIEGMCKIGGEESVSPKNAKNTDDDK